jgi:hypothetical protein
LLRKNTDSNAPILTIQEIFIDIYIPIEKRKRPGQRRMSWSAPTEIKETRRAEGDSMLTYRRAESEGH